MKISKWWGSERRKEFLMKISEINKIIKDELRKNRDSSVNYKNYLSSFHIPFEMRTNVMNYRYSISGHPCFYFGNTILTCWEEMHCPSLDDLVVSRIEVQANETLKVLDLRLPKEENKGDDKKIANKRLLMTWPLIIACSIKTITPNAPFKFEYVHPQLLMLALKENNKEYWSIPNGVY